jgi:hypothetical protein
MLVIQAELYGKKQPNVVTVEKDVYRRHIKHVEVTVELDNKFYEINTRESRELFRRQCVGYIMNNDIEYELNPPIYGNIDCYHTLFQRLMRKNNKTHANGIRLIEGDKTRDDDLNPYRSYEVITSRKKKRVGSLRIGIILKDDTNFLKKKREMKRARIDVIKFL